MDRMLRRPPTTMNAGALAISPRREDDVNDNWCIELVDEYELDPADLRDACNTVRRSLRGAGLGRAVRQATEAALSRLDNGDGDLTIVTRKSPEGADDLARLDALFMSAAAGNRLAADAAQEYLRRHGPGETLGNEDMEKLGRLVDASLAALGHQQLCADRVRHIMAGEVASRSVTGFSHLSPNELMQWKNSWNQRAERNKPPVPAY